MYVFRNVDAARAAIPGIHHQTLAGQMSGLAHLSIWRQVMDAGAATPPHRHDCEEVVIVEAGSGELGRRRRTRLRPGHDAGDSARRQPPDRQHRQGNDANLGGVLRIAGRGVPAQRRAAAAAVEILAAPRRPRSRRAGESPRQPAAATRSEHGGEPPPFRHPPPIDGASKRPSTPWPVALISYTIADVLSGPSPNTCRRHSASGRAGRSAGSPPTVCRRGRWCT